ncbi:kinase-like domain-containing protein, partial [Collybia nuda]
RREQRLNQEVNIFMRLDHPNIVKFYGISFVFGGEPAMVMQWCEKGTATTFARHQPISDKLQLVKDICAGVEYLHTLEPPIVHGDLKGDNVLISDEGHAMLNDFGLSSKTQQYGCDTLGGSLRWQAPELLFDSISDGREDEWISSPQSTKSDVWAFACTTYEVLLGRLPYHDRQLNWAIIQEIMQGKGPLRPDDTLIHGSTKLLELMVDCWALRPSDRPCAVVIASRLGGIFL